MKYDAVIIGAGPNGLSAAITLARAGRKVAVYEASGGWGGGVSSLELTLPGFVHDVCSAVHPFAVSTPFFKSLPLEAFGLKWIYPDLPLVHPFTDGSAVKVERSLEATCTGLGGDGEGYKNLIEPFVMGWDTLTAQVMAPFHFPRPSPVLFAFAWRSLRSAEGLAKAHLRTEHARALFAGFGAHSILPLNALGSGAFALLMTASAHESGWPFPQGGAQKLSDALALYLRDLGGEIVTNRRIQDLNELPDAASVLCDLTPKQLLALGGTHLSDTFRHQLQKFRYGPAVFKIDWALKAPIPWRNSTCAKAGTLHLGGFEEICNSEREVSAGRVGKRPFVILSQPSLFDSSRAPAPYHTAWAYIHVPNGCAQDFTSVIEDEIERYAPGFKTHIMKRSVWSPARLQEHNANLVGGDIGGGSNVWTQLLTRPTWRMYRTSNRRLYMCSASTPPGGGVHGLCGYYAAQDVLRD